MASRARLLLDVAVDAVAAGFSFLPLELDFFSGLASRSGSGSLTIGSRGVTLTRLRGAAAKDDSVVVDLVVVLRADGRTALAWAFDTLTVMTSSSS